MTIEVTPVVKVLLAFFMLLIISTFISTLIKNYSNNKILDTMYQMQRDRIVDSMEYIHVKQKVDSLSAQTRRQEVEIIHLKSNLEREVKHANQLEKDINILRISIGVRPDY